MGGLRAALRTGFVVAGVVGEMTMPALAGKDIAAQCRRAAMSDRPDGAVLLRRECRGRFERLRDKTAQRSQHGGGRVHELGAGLDLAGELVAEPVHQLQRILGALVSQMQIHHGGINLFMAEQFLDRVQMCAGLEKMRREGMTKRMHRSSREVELFARHDDQPLERGTGHRTRSGVHAPRQRLR